MAVLPFLSACVFMFFAMALFANPLTNPAIKEHISDAFAAATWINDDWLSGIVMVVGLLVAFALVGIYVGLYAGSMFRRPK